MRVQVNFIVNKDLDFYSPLNEAMTAFIYRAIAEVDEEYATKLHEGYKKVGYKKYVFFVYNISQNKRIAQFHLKKGIATLVFSSAVKETVIKFVQGLMKIGSIQLFGYSFNIHSISYIKEPALTNSEIFQAVSPVYATRIDGKWLKPREMEVKLGENLIEKYYALYGKLPARDVKIKILSHRPEYFKYKKDTYRGYVGLIALEGDRDLIRLAYNAGLGSRCGQGMGLLEKVEFDKCC